MHRRPYARRQGFTLVELAIAAALLALVMASLALVGRASKQAYQSGMVSSHLESQTKRAMDHVVRELRIAGVDTITPDPVAGIGGADVRFLQARASGDGQVQWSALRRLAFEYESGELDDGVDNNGNGLVDEGRLVLIENIGEPEERTRVLTHWVAEYLEGELENGLDDNGNGLVDERGFTLERLGEALIVRLTLQRRGDGGQLQTRTGQTSTRPRNRLEAAEEEE